MALEIVENKTKVVPTQPGSFRHTVQQACKRYKNAWAELGKLLLTVRNEALFEQWGYADFYTYCKAELSIHRLTADKLTRNFAFLDKHEPEAVKKQDFASAAPAFEVVEVLAQAEERGQLSANEYKSIRDSIWNPEKPVSEMRRELNEMFPPPPPEPLGDREALRRVLSIARKLAAEMHASAQVPKGVAERADALVEDLAELVKANKTKA